MTEMPVRVGFVKSTCSLRQSVMSVPAATMSPRPSSRAGTSSSCATGTNTTCTRRCLFLSRLLRSSSNSLKASGTRPRGVPWSMKNDVFEYVVSTRIKRRSIMPSRSPVHFASAIAATPVSGMSTVASGAAAGVSSVGRGVRPPGRIPSRSRRASTPASQQGEEQSRPVPESLAHGASILARVPRILRPTRNAVGSIVSRMILPDYAYFANSNANNSHYYRQRPGDSLAY